MPLRVCSAPGAAGAHVSILFFSVQITMASSLHFTAAVSVIASLAGPLESLGTRLFNDTFYYYLVTHVNKLLSQYPNTDTSNR